MKTFLQCISLFIFNKLISAETNETEEVANPKGLLSKHKVLMKAPQKPTEETVSSSSEEDDGFVIKISENKKKKLNSGTKKANKQKNASDKKMTKSNPISLVKPAASSVVPQPTQKTEKSKPNKISPFDFDTKKSSTKPSTSPFTKKSSKPDTFSPIDSTYKSPTSDFLLKDFESKTVKITLSEQEVKDLESLSKNLDSFIPSLTRTNVIVKNIVKASNKEDEANKNKTNKPSELFNIKVIEVSDNNTPN